MIAPKTAFFKTALNGLYYSGAYRALRRRWSGIGVIFTLHHVRPADAGRTFAPNRILEITPDFLEQTVEQVRRLGYETVSLDELRRRLVERDFRRPVVCFTLDDGYADNYVHAFPVFEKHRVPFALYVCTGLVDGVVSPWWRDLERIVTREPRIEVELNGDQCVFDTRDARSKRRAFRSIYWALREMPHELQLETQAALGRRYPADPGPGPEFLSWPMLDEMLRSGLLEVGAHTVNHYALSKLSAEALRTEIETSREVLARRTGVVPRHFAYPYGDPGSAGRREFAMAEELGFATAVTTRKGVLFPEHRAQVHALPRVSLNGDYQKARYVELFLSGAPFALLRGFRRESVS